jgi:hypothetical protein
MRTAACGSSPSSSRTGEAEYRDAGLAKRIVNGDTPVLGEHGRMPM